MAFIVNPLVINIPDYPYYAQKYILHYLTILIYPYISLLCQKNNILLSFWKNPLQFFPKSSHDVFRCRPVNPAWDGPSPLDG